jgi:hypothetical protein
VYHRCLSLLLLLLLLLKLCCFQRVPPQNGLGQTCQLTLHPPSPLQLHTQPSHGKLERYSLWPRWQPIRQAFGSVAQVSSKRGGHLDTATCTNFWGDSYHGALDVE